MCIKTEEHIAFMWRKFCEDYPLDTCFICDKTSCDCVLPDEPPMWFIETLYAVLTEGGN